MKNIKTKSHAFGKDVYYLGKGKDGDYYWLEESKFDCGWYWGLRYVETYEQNRLPEKARDISSHSHFDSMFFNQKHDAHTEFKAFFESTPLSDKEIWTLCELMKSAYIFREYSDTIYRGGAHYTNNPCADIIKNNDEYDRINKIVLPAIFEEIYKLFSE